MGIFTWTDAIRAPRMKNKWDYRDEDIIGYGGFAKIVCPDDTEITTTYYHGDGMFGFTDAYEVVVDWNIADLVEIAERKREDDFGKQLYELAVMYGNGESEAQVSRKAKKLYEAGKIPHYLIAEWKRNIGIMLCCENEDNDSLKYPLKITRTKEKVLYKDLVPSYNTQ